MSKNQKHKEEVDRVLDICKAMGEAIPAKSTKQDVIDAAELIIVNAIMQTSARGLRLTELHLQVLKDISRLFAASQEQERMMEDE